LEDLRAYLEGNAASLPPEYAETAASLRKLAAEVERHYTDLEALEQRLTVLEEKMIAAARVRQSEEELLESRRELDRQLRPYRGKMTADQLAMLEKQYLERNLLERARLPRLSLFYMR
jgi:DNA repair exonuclease SbcCD ATPase subunit